MGGLYEHEILERRANLRFKKPVASFDVLAKGENPFCGDSIEVQVRFASDGSLVDIGFLGYACIVCEVAGDLLCEQALGKKPREILLFDLSFVEGLFGNRIPPARRRCALLVLDTLKSTLVNKIQT